MLSRYVFGLHNLVCGEGPVVALFGLGVMSHLSPQNAVKRTWIRPRSAIDLFVHGLSTLAQGRRLWQRNHLCSYWVHLP